MVAPLAGPDRRLASAYGTCARVARRHSENFPVASRLLPPAMRPDVAAVYAFARTADDFADEGDLPAAERLGLLDWWLEAIREEAAGDGPGPAGGAALCAGPGLPPGRPPGLPEAADIVAALGATIRRRHLPLGLFEDLLSAFRQDVTVRRYEGWEQLIDYCRRSANPVGRLVLRIAGREEASLDRASDDVCTALQLTNFWQDLARDWSRGRLYVPSCDLDRFGARAEDLDRGRLSGAWREVMAEMVARTKALFDRGRPICDRVGGRLGFELRLTWLGGVAILEQVGAAGFDPFGRRPALGAGDLVRLAGGAVRWRRATGA